MTHCFEPGHYKGLIDEIAFDDVAKPWFKKYDAEWREDLKEGDTIDVQYRNSRMTVWRSGLIESANGDELTILLPQFGFKKVKDRWSSAIAKGGTHARFDQEWRRRCLGDPSLSGLKIQCLFNTINWVESTILETKKVVREDCEVWQALVRFPEDHVMGESYGDEWISIYHPRIQPHLSRTGYFNDNDNRNIIISEANLDELHMPEKSGQIK